MRVKNDKKRQAELDLYVEPLGELCFSNSTGPGSILTEPAFEIYKQFLSSDSKLKVMLLTGEAGVGKTLFCKYLQNVILCEWNNLSEESWLPIYCDITHFKNSCLKSSLTKSNFTLSEILKEELLLPENEIHVLHERSLNKEENMPRLLFILDECDQLL